MVTAEWRRFSRRLWQPIASHAARAYVAGPQLEDALRTCRRLATRRITATICPWNKPGEAPRHVCDRYLAAVRALGASTIDGYLSIKAPALGFSSELVSEIVETAAARGVRVHFDALAPGAAQQTWALIARAAERYSGIGCTLPARWRRSKSDVCRAVEHGLAVRVVKGQWADSESADGDIRSQFTALVRLLAGRARHVAVATHDHALAGPALACLRRSDTPCELELLLGLPRRPGVQVARSLGVGVRMYVPYGHAALPYDIGDVRTTRRVAWWAAKDWLLAWLS